MLPTLLFVYAAKRLAFASLRKKMLLRWGARSGDRSLSGIAKAVSILGRAKAHRQESCQFK
jgi:hypothetical protein